MNQKERLIILGISKRLSVRTDVDWVRLEINKLNDLANKIDHRICPKCKGNGILKVKR